MVSLVVRAAAALPSGRARPLGSGRLPLAALSRQGAVVLAGRKLGVGAGHGGELASVFKVWVAKASSDTPPEGSNDEEVELVQWFRNRLDRNMKSKGAFEGFVENPLGNSRQFMLAIYGEQSFSLWALVANQFKASVDSKIYEVLRLCGDTFIDVLVRSRKGYASAKNASDLLDALELLRRLVSSTLKTPLTLPLDYGPFSLEHEDPEVVLIETVGRTFLMVDKDVKSMLKIEK